MTAKAEKAKAFLMSYKEAYHEYIEILEIMDRLDHSEPQSPKLTGLPHGTEVNDLSGIVAAAQELKKEYEARLEVLRSRMAKVKDAIEGLVIERDRMILSLRYIDFMTYTDIVEVMGEDMNTVYKRHERALERITWKN